MAEDKINFFADINTTRGKIISVACEILKEGNYQSMTTSEIAKAADISEGTIYRYFSSKKEILLTVLDELNNYFIKTFFAGIDNNKTHNEKLNIIGQNFFIHKDELASLYSIMFRVFSEVSDLDVKERFKQIYEKILKQITILLFGNDLDQNLQSEFLMLSTYFLWGAGELLWKLDIVNDGNILNEKLIHRMLDIISKMIDFEKNRK